MTWTSELAFVSDVHSNLEALDAVLEDIGDRETYCLGDVVGYGASPNEVIARLREKGAICILGNHDSAVLSGRANEFNARAMQAVAWTARNISGEGREFLAGLPLSRTIDFAGRRVFMTHGSP
jgi:predicted phosphodiesterase